MIYSFHIIIVCTILNNSKDDNIVYNYFLLFNKICQKYSWQIAEVLHQMRYEIHLIYGQDHYSPFAGSMHVV